jgi:hypothetical protein
MILKTANLTAFLLLVILSVLSVSARASEEVKPLSITWEKIEGHDKYKVQITDSGGSIVLDKTVATNHIEFILPVGVYKIRIGAISVFDKISFWSDWDMFEIRQPEKWEFFTNDYVEGVGLKISAGMSYDKILPKWNRFYYDTFGYRCIIGLHFGNSKYIKPTGFMRFAGIELEVGYRRYNDRDRKNPLFHTDIKNLTGGVNFFVKTNLKIPLNFYIVVGGGISDTELKYKRYNPSLFSKAPIPIQRGTRKTLDPYGKAGAGIEFNLLYALSLDIGADYFTIFYRDKFFSGLRYHALIGVRI